MIKEERQLTIPEMVWIGADVGKTAHHPTAVDADGIVLWSVQVSKRPGGPLLALLVTTDQPVGYVPGRMAGAFGECKTDARDAKVIAETARPRRDPREIATPDQLVVERSVLTGHRTVLVAGYCTPEAIRQAGEQGLTDHLREHGTHRASIPTVRTLDKTLAERFRAHPTTKIIESMPGTGPTLGAEFLAGDLTVFGSPARLAACSSLRIDGPSRELCQRRRSEHQRHAKAIIALARRLVDVLWALPRENRLRQPAAPNAAIA
ncbi:IS110 family transposase [Actinophytocola sp.]|uniref:IS110 family transposase n=1 Tax=Actinophytocola sp. TaxID=1872138 RepID=UPI003D6A9388